MMTIDNLRQDHCLYLLTSCVSDGFQVSQYFYWCNIRIELSGKIEGAYL